MGPEALAGLGLGHESLTVRTRLGDTNLIAIGPEGAPPAVFFPGGNFLNPTCLSWFLPLAESHRLYAPDIVGQPGRSAQERPSPKGDGHAFWVEDVFDGLAGARAGGGSLLRGGPRHQDHGTRPRTRLKSGARQPFVYRRRLGPADARPGGLAHAPLPSPAHAGAPPARCEAPADGAREYTTPSCAGRSSWPRGGACSRASPKLHSPNFAQTAF